MPFQAFQPHDGQGAQFGWLELVELFVGGLRDRFQPRRERVGGIARRNPVDHAFGVTVVGVGAQRNVRQADHRTRRGRLNRGGGERLSVRGAERQARHQHQYDQAEKRLGMGAHVTVPVGGCCESPCGRGLLRYRGSSGKGK
ncbi:hypothetical protein D9M68_620220 [compost metagenome]